MCRITVNQELGVTRAGGCVIKSRGSITETYITACFTLSLTQIYQMGKVFCECRLAFDQRRQWRAAQRPVLQILTKDMFVTKTRNSTLRL